DRLSERFEFGLCEPLKVQASVDGTKKYLYPAKEDKFIETAYIPDQNRATLCVSSQVGCKMNCLFCMTGKQGFQGQLTAGEILNQLFSLPERDKVTNLVYMGMGEPFDNLQNVLDSLEILTSDWGCAMSPKRITVSSIGVIPGIRAFLERSNCHLAISLHNPFDDERSKIMPVQKAYPIREVLNEIRSFPMGPQRRVSFEYIMFKGFNDTPRHIKELARILNGIECRINLIRFHTIPGVPFEGSDDETIASFNKALNHKGILTTTRASRGLDIFAACGMLSTKALVQPGI
ncbi:MAG: 23S rRNA (adenine(2503)-C(2))-methyltransferase RlmN, partial [Bacteroidota bacterium]|nr:23S rRNA (adenine(2503)-C(2))-methyltransferase RlmN [Bacteroidota bacterium]